MSKGIEGRLRALEDNQERISSERRNLESKLSAVRVKEILHSGVLQQLKFTAKAEYNEWDAPMLTLEAHVSVDDPFWWKLAGCFGATPTKPLSWREATVNVPSMHFKLWRYSGVDVTLTISFPRKVSTFKRFIRAHRLDVDDKGIREKLQYSVNAAKAMLKEREEALNEWIGEPQGGKEIEQGDRKETGRD